MFRSETEHLRAPVPSAANRFAVTLVLRERRSCRVVLRVHWRSPLPGLTPQTRQLEPSEVCNDLLIFMLAGHDTTATALTYALWVLGRYPDVQDRVAAEVAQLGDAELTPNEVPRLEYTVQVLNEALRLCPPAAGVGRIALRDIAVSGHRVEAGTLLAVGIYALHRDPAIWPDPGTFDPGRFSPENSAGRDRWHFLPFAGGARSCIGEHFARLELTLALATLVISACLSSIVSGDRHAEATVNRAGKARLTRRAVGEKVSATDRSPIAPPRPWASPAGR